MDEDTTRLVPPAVSSLRAQAIGRSMERSLSSDIREEREELREAAESTLNIIVDLNLDGTIRWVSPSWADVIGTQPETIEGTPIADLIISEDKSAFAEAIESMREDDSRSQYIRFTVYLGRQSKLYPTDVPEAEAGEDVPATVELEAQGIMVYDRTTGDESHTMWMLRPWIAPREIKIDLAPLLVESLGSGAEVLASYLTQLAESGNEDPANHPRPPPVLCRICERQIPPWWFEKHTDLCLQEHRAEMDVQIAQENLTEHRHSIVKVLDALEARKSRALSGDFGSAPIAEYQGLSIGPTSSTSSPGAASPASSSRDRSTGFSHNRSRSFAVRRPQARIVELLLDLCDTAIEISTPAIKESSSQSNGEFRTQSPQSESRISQVLQWQSPGSNTLEQEQGLALLCTDTEKVSKEKVEAVFRHRRIIEYAERIRIEFSVIVENCIDDAMRKAARIAAGLSDSTEDEETEEEEEEEVEETPVAQEEPVFSGSFDTPSSLAIALGKVELSDTDDRRRPSSIIGSTRSSSPGGCPTPKSHREVLAPTSQPRDSRRGSNLIESDAGDSDGSGRSASVARQPYRTDSPMSDLGGLRRATSSRQHHRRSLILAGTSSPHRQESPSRSNQPSSPLRIHKPRNLQYSQEGIVSPEASPMLPNSEFGSPAIIPHHRRQSSAALSEFPNRQPTSPRLNAANHPPMARAVPPSIKDFEIIKPISRGAFGSVYLSKKKSTGEYFAIKVLKKADMVAKNQVTNVKAERAIMMWQGESEFVAKLYWTFSSKDYLYLVMEYLNGGDCASLIKVLGGLPEEWVKKYLGEVILGVEHLHDRHIIHRDLKPDNLLIDQKGHLKLTDFGLSRMGLVGRQKRALDSGSSEPTPDLLKTGPFVRSTSIASSRSTSLDFHGIQHSPGTTPQITPDNGAGQPSYFNLSQVHPEPRRISGQRSDSGGSETLTHMMGNFSLNDPQLSQSSVRSPHDEGSDGGNASPDLPSLQHTSSHTSDLHRNTPPQSSMMPPPMALFDPDDTNRRFVGTPDYLAPETIKGARQDETSDWWSVGCILFEFLYGYPPFHADEADHVFENILARKITWPDEDDISPEAKDLINKLLTIDPQQRLGANREAKYASGGEEIRNHPWFEGINWDTLLQDDAQFVPQPENPEDTEYFDARGATLQSFTEEIEDQSSPQPTATPDYPDRPHDALSRVRSQVQVNQIKRGLMPLHIPPHIRDLKSRRLSEPVASDDFGSFAFKNLTVLDKANKDVIQQLKAQAMAAHGRSGTSPGGNNPPSPAPTLEGSPVLAMPVQRNLSNAKASASQRPQSPSAASHANSSPSRASQPSSPLLVSFHAGQGADGRRKASSNASSLSQQSGSGSLQPGSFFDVPRTTPSLQKSASAATPSPVKVKGAPPPLPLSPHKAIGTPRQASGSSTRSRSLTVGSQEGSPVAADLLAHHRNRRSQVFDMSPSSSDNEGERANALLKVQRRRQSSRRMSAIMLDSPTFRSLDVLICEDHPVSRMVMEKLLEKLRCRTISASTGSDAVRYAVSEIKFDIIFTEFKLPEISGTDVARMVREVKNVNAHTPIVAITAYLKELQAPHYFDSLIEKPISSSKLIEVLSKLCQWKPPSPGQALSIPIPNPITSIKLHNPRLEDSPTSGSSGFTHPTSSSFRGSSREDSISSSLFGDSESATTDEVSVIGRKATGEWREDSGLGISNEEPTVSSGGASSLPIPLISQQSAPAQTEQPRMPVPKRSLEKLRSRREHLEKKRLEGNDSADDEDDELGTHRDRGFRGKQPPPSSKLGIEMMRANSHESVAIPSDTTTAEPLTQVVTPAREADVSPLSGARPPSKASQTPPETSTSESETTDEICYEDAIGEND
ncbi:hypothetical protein M426DRAFT_74794 [Hypoxylon sp. CI-4A]|nr:hypothetical protein M426DRAFT_74794 [Hypoxylon sp. CI-4A]